MDMIATLNHSTELIVDRRFMRGTQPKLNESVLANRKAGRPGDKANNKYNPTIPSKYVKSYSSIEWALMKLSTNKTNS